MPYCASCVVHRHQLHHTHALKTDHLLPFRSVPLKPSGPQQLPIVTHSLGRMSAPSCGNIIYLLDAGPTVFPRDACCDSASSLLILVSLPTVVLVSFNVCCYEKGEELPD